MVYVATARCSVPNAPNGPARPYRGGLARCTASETGILGSAKARLSARSRGSSTRAVSVPKGDRPISASGGCVLGGCRAGNHRAPRLPLPGCTSGVPHVAPLVGADGLPVPAACGAAGIPWSEAIRRCAHRQAGYPAGRAPYAGRWVCRWRAHWVACTAWWVARVVTRWITGVSSSACARPCNSVRSSHAPMVARVCMGTG
jgi:hypothetical protein